ncbi:MAG: polyphosphate polymerase domain-containing protein [Deltaproteobacteria bacterium]|nr:polyphosphate polymerase domain-containing protein [Deltaproteobacteria bacterium]
MAELAFKRTERKYLVSTEAVPAVVAAIEQNLPLQEFVPGEPLTTVCSLYLDTPDHRLLAEARRSREDHLKVRLREYSYQNGSLHGSRYCFVELKARRGMTRDKIRFGLPKRDVAAFLAGEELSAAVAAADPQGAEESLRHYERIRQLVIDLGLRASLLVAYRRVAYESPEAGLRLSLDREVSYHLVTPRLEAHLADLWVMGLDRPVGKTPAAILEVKHRGPLPVWFERLTQKQPGVEGGEFSKYESGMGHLLGQLSLAAV